jgi:hypothetical protein
LLLLILLLLFSGFTLDVLAFDHIDWVHSEVRAFPGVVGSSCSHYSQVGSDCQFGLTRSPREILLRSHEQSGCTSGVFRVLSGCCEIGSSPVDVSWSFASTFLRVPSRFPKYSESSQCVQKEREREFSECVPSGLSVFRALNTSSCHILNAFTLLW